MAPRKPDKDNKKNIRNIISIVVWALLLTVMFNYLTSLASKGSSTEITYSEFVSMVKNGEVASVAINESEGKLVITTVTAANAPEGTEAAKEELYTGILDDAQLLPLLEENGVEFGGVIPTAVSPVMTFLLSWVIPLVAMYFLLTLLFRGMGGAGGMGGIGGIGGIGKSRAI